MGFLSNIINDVKPRTPVPMRVALGGSLSQTADDSVIVAGTETSPDDTARHVESQNFAERPAMRITEYDSTRSRSRDVSISGFRQSPVQTDQPLPLYHQPPIPKQDEANEQSVSPMPKVDTSDHGDISIENDDRERPRTESSERSTPHRQANNMPTGASAPAPSITDNGAQPLMKEKSVSDAVTQSSKPDADTHAPSYTLSEYSPPLAQSQQTSNRQHEVEDLNEDADRERPPAESSERPTPYRRTNNMPTDVSAPAPSITGNKSGDGAQPPMLQRPVSDAVPSSLKPDADTHVPLHTPSEQSPPREQTRQTSNRQHEIDRPTIETPVAQPAHHPVSASTPSIPPSTMAEPMSPERALLQSNSSPVSGTDSDSSNISLSTLKPIEAASRQVPVRPWGPSYPPPPERKPEPTVQIGQVDILVSAPETARLQSDSKSKPHNIASRRYLRRL